jgi:hypothetical protein
MQIGKLVRLGRGSGGKLAPRALLGSITVAAALLGAGAATADGVAGGRTPVSSAHVARVEALRETLTLSITKIKGNTIYAQGKSRGAINGTGVFYLTLINASHAKAEMTGNNSHGSVRAAGAAKYRVSGAVSYFSGTVTRFAGARGYAHARSLGISFEGKLNRSTFEASVKLHGRWDS